MIGGNMRKSNLGFTLIELIVTLAIAAMVIPIGYSLLFVGNGMFNVSAGKGLSQQNVRLLADFTKNELQYVTRISDDASDFHTRYYSVEYNDTLNQFIKRYYVFNDATMSVDESIVQTINGDWDVLSISNLTAGVLNVSVGHEEIIGNKASRFDLPFNVNLVNATSLDTSISIDLTHEISGDPVRLYYIYAKDDLVNVSIGITDLTSDGSDEVIGIRSINFDANTGTGSIAPITQNIGTDIVIPSNTGISKTGYTFIGWNVKADETGVMYVTGSTIKMPSDSLVLYAIWRKNTIVIDDVTLGDVLFIDDESPKTDAGKYLVKKGMEHKIRVKIIGFTINHTVNVESTVSGQGATVSLTNKILGSEPNHYIELTLKTPNANNREIQITIKSKTNGFDARSKSYKFITVN